ncbi:hypothetical protein AX16_007565 [Volvariella volvacea WC 439]|nr:hypothetical protein AX16_007565 [Volvariella volvacea WC 439]
MSHINPLIYRLSVKSFANVPSIVPAPGMPTWDEELGNIARPERSDGRSSVVSQDLNSNASGSDRRIIARNEPCFITKSISYAHDQAHWVNAVRKDSRRKWDIEAHLRQLGIVGYTFDLDHPSNLCHLDPFIHRSLDMYAFVAVTASLETLDVLINLIKNENNARENIFRTSGIFPQRHFDFNADCFSNPTYELVVLHPEHFLPAGRQLTIYSTQTLSHKSYVVATDRKDRRLREYPGDSSCPPLPPFTFNYTRDNQTAPNPFLIILNAEIKFRRYRRQLAVNPPKDPLPPHVLQLIDRTIELVELIYWLPPGQRHPAFRELERPRGPVLYREPESEGDDDVSEPGEGISQRKRKRDRTPPPEISSGAQMTYGRALISGDNFEYDSDDERVLEELGSGCTNPKDMVYAWQKTIESH